MSIEESLGVLLQSFPQGPPQPLAATGERSLRGELKRSKS